MSNSLPLIKPTASSLLRNASLLSNRKYVILAGPCQEGLAERLVAMAPDTFTYFPSNFAKFPDGTDNIELGGFSPINRIHDTHLLFLASFHTNDATLSQIHALLALAESFLASLTIILPFLPTATMERVTKEGVVATANTTAKILSAIPACGRPTRVMLYDLHTLQNRFYFGQNSVASLHSTFPLLVKLIADKANGINCVCFPDDGAEKRFGHFFKKSFPDIEIITCGKHRDDHDPLKRVVVIGNGNPKGHNVVICDDLVRSGGTLIECAKALKKAGANDVSVFVAHAAFDTPTAHTAFMRGGKHEGILKNFYVSNSNPYIIQRLPKDDIFVELDITPLIIGDLEFRGEY